jgi:hypothetical protein
MSTKTRYGRKDRRRDTSDGEDDEEDVIRYRMSLTKRQDTGNYGGSPRPHSAENRLLRDYGHAVRQTAERMALLLNKESQ